MIELQHFIIETVPSWELNPNRQRSQHWAVLAAKVKLLHDRTYYDVRQHGFWPLEGPVDAWATVCWASKQRVVTDQDNLRSMLKGMWDGFTEAGVWVDDSELTVVHVDQWVMEKAAKSFHRDGCIVVAIKPGEARECIPPLQRDGSVSQLWLDGIPA